MEVCLKSIYMGSTRKKEEIKKELASGTSGDTEEQLSGRYME